MMTIDERIALAQRPILDSFRASLRTLDMLALLARLDEARRWWAKHASGPHAVDLTPLIEEEMRCRV